MVLFSVFINKAPAILAEMADRVSVPIFASAANERMVVRKSQERARTAA